MFRHLFGARDQFAGYIPLSSLDVEDNSVHFNRLPLEVFIKIANEVGKQGTWQDVIAFFLTNKKTFRCLTDLDGKNRIANVTVTIGPLANKSDSTSPQPWEVCLKNVNYVLLANYYQQIKLERVQPELDELKEKSEQSKCIAEGVGISVGLAVGIGVVAGLGYVCHTIIVPGLGAHTDPGMCDCCYTPAFQMISRIACCDILFCGPIGYLAGVGTASLPFAAEHYFNRDRDARIDELKFIFSKTYYRMSK